MRRALVGGLAALGAAVAGAAPAAPGWGIDACVTVHPPAAQMAPYLDLLRRAHVTVLREREPSERLAPLKAAGETVICSVDFPGLRPARAGDQLPEDLSQVFQAAERMVRQYHALVDGWEVLGEPDVGYCRDLPDRYAAFEKAVYLGIKAESRRLGLAAPPVAMGALALPPGPWLGRAAANGLLEYTDCYNFHYYGRIEDFAGVVAAHRSFLQERRPGLPPMPLWITECGFNPVDPAGAFLDPVRRARQARYVAAAARQAAKETDLALFMPFILVHAGDPYAITEAPDRVLPAWKAYAAITRGIPWPARPWALAARNPSPVVLQWLPTAATAIPHKVSGTYRFPAGRPIQGAIRIYNFGGRPAEGRLSIRTGAGVVSSFAESQAIKVGAGACVEIPGTLAPRHAGYLAADFSAVFEAREGRSTLAFGLESIPSPEDFTLRELPLAFLPEPRMPYADAAPGGSAGVWRGWDGVQPGEPEGTDAIFHLGGNGADPLHPPLATAGIPSGLPAADFLVVDPGGGAEDGADFRVDLIDDRGERFTVWENLGRDYFQPERQIWLNLRDFHLFWAGRCEPGAAFEPHRIREVQLRFFRLNSARIRLRLATRKEER